MKRIIALLLPATLLVGCAQEAPEAEPAAPLKVGAQVSAPKFTTMEYPSKNALVQTLEIYPPKGGKDLRRAVILIHGGGWLGGNKEDMRAIGESLAKEGFTGISLNYTLAQAKIWPAQLEDVQAAVRFVRSKAADLKIDPKWIAAAGVSAGGHLSMFLGTTDAPEKGISSKVQAVCSISGIHDLNSTLTPAGNRYGIIEALMGEHGAPDKGARKKASPVEMVAKNSAPTLFVQGKMDPLVPQSQSDLALNRLKKMGVDTKEILVDGMGHGIQPTTPQQIKALGQISDWLKAHLGVK